MPTNSSTPSVLGPSFLGEAFRIKIPLASLGNTGTVVASLVNPLGEALIIEQAILDLTTVATGASTLDIGVAATAIANDTLFDGLDVNAATGVFSSHVSGGTNGLGTRKWAATGYVTVTDASGDPTGLVGTLILVCSKLK